MTMIAPRSPRITEGPYDPYDSAPGAAGSLTGGPPTARLRAVAARALFRRAVSGLPVQVVLDGRSEGTGPRMRIHRPEAFFARLGADGLIGFGEAYMAGDWDAGDRPDDLPSVLTAFAARMGTLVPPALQRLRPLAVRRPPAAHGGDPAGARRNIRHHYDLSNALFELFLDETMTYSSALFEEDAAGRPVTGGGDREQAAAQHRKIDRLLDAARVGPGTRLLEIGTGWGELALRAGARGADVRSITLSAEQRALALRRVDAAGLTGRVRVDLCDYREVAGEYDAIVSVEMIEAVGDRYWPAYFRTLERSLAPGGRVSLQSITMPHDRMLASRRTHTWIQKYIFPGGLIPSVRAIDDNAARAGLRVVERHGFGAHYAETLRIWRRRFLDAGHDVDRLGFDPVFRRMWELYLAYSEAGFRSGYLDVHRFVLARAGDRVGDRSSEQSGERSGEQSGERS